MPTKNNLISSLNRSLAIIPQTRWIKSKGIKLRFSVSYLCKYLSKTIISTSLRAREEGDSWGQSAGKASRNLTARSSKYQSAMRRMDLGSPIASRFVEHDICALMFVSTGGKVPPGVKVKRTSGWKMPLLRDRAFEVGVGTALNPVCLMRKETGNQGFLEHHLLTKSLELSLVHLSSLFLCEASEIPSFRVYLWFPHLDAVTLLGLQHIANIWGNWMAMIQRLQGHLYAGGAIAAFPSCFSKKLKQKPWVWSLMESNRTCFSVQAKLINTSFLELWLREQHIALKVRPHHREVA